MRMLAAALLPLWLAACSPLTAFNALVPQDGGTRRIVSGAAFGPDPRHRVDLYAPTAPAGPRPVIVFFYGGSWSSGERAGYAFAARALASRGFLVAVPDYRLVPGVRFPAFLEDNAAAVRWVRGHAAAYGGDPDRLILAGHSAGAYNAAMLALDPQWLGADRAAVRGWVGIAGPYDFLPFDRPASRDAFGAWPDPEATQPIRHAGAGDPPALLLAGGEDRVIGAHNARNLAAALTKAGVVAETRTYPRLGHVEMLTTLSPLFRRKAPILDDVARFARRVSADAAGAGVSAATP